MFCQLVDQGRGDLPDASADPSLIGAVARFATSKYGNGIGRAIRKGDNAGFVTHHPHEAATLGCDGDGRAET